MSAVDAATGQQDWWRLPAASALALLDAEESGLSGDEAARRLGQYGPNEIEEGGGVSPLRILVRQFASPLIYILLIAAVVTVLVREFIDAGIIGGVLVFNAVIGFTQELRAERSMAALRRLATTRAHVIRDRRERDVDARELVPGDVVVVEAGSKVPADCRVLHASALEADESLLTGESATVTKSAQVLDVDLPLGDRANMIFMGSIVTRGRGRALVVATGARSQLGHIAGSVRETTAGAAPLVERMARFARIVGVAVLVVSLAAFAAGLAAGESAHDLFLTLVALAVSAIPEGLPVVLTITLAVGVSRMASRGVIIRRLPAVETLGSCTVIGSDKTGTLTQNRMTVVEVFAGGQDYAVTGAGYGTAGGIVDEGGPVGFDLASALGLTLLAGCLCNEASIFEGGEGEYIVQGDPTEIALLVAAAKAGILKDDMEDRFPRWAEIPFDPERRFAATFHRGEGKDFVFLKGAPEQVLAMCDSMRGGERLEAGAALAAADAMARNGRRVLAMAYVEGEAGSLEVTERVGGLVFLGLESMIDPPREEVRDAIRGCREAGIRVVMITGDHAATALAIGQQLGIAAGDGLVLTGEDVGRLTPEGLEEAVRRVSVFARVSPEHKLRIVGALQRNGHVVAVTGDGVNDGPALAAANIGVAMGKSGTDVAKEAADMVITDDNFASIFAAVEEGRVVFDNIRKVTFFLIATGVGEVLSVLASIVLRAQLPFLPAQLLWLNLVTNGVQDVALAFEPGEKDALTRPPRPAREGIISPILWERTAIAGLVLACGTLGLFLLETGAGASVERARTVAVTTMVLFQVFHVGNCRSEYLSLFRKSPLSNPFLFLGTAIALSVHIGALYFGPTQYILRVEPLDAVTWLKMGAVASSVILAVEVHKLVRHPRRDRTAVSGTNSLG